MPSFLDKDGFQHFVDSRIGHADYTGLGATITEALMNSGGSRVGITIKRDAKKNITDVVYVVKQNDYVVTKTVPDDVEYVEVSGFRDISPITVTINFKLEGTPTSLVQTIEVDGYFKYDVLFRLGGEIWDGWLATSNIDAEYDTMEDLIADKQAMQVLFANHASIDYFVNWCANDSTLWPKFRDNLTVQKTIAKYDYSWEKIDEIPGARDYFLNGDNWELFLPDHVPTMTSNTAPEGEAKASSESGVYYAYRAFDGLNDGTDKNMGWGSSDGGKNGWIQYKFSNPICVRRAYFENRAYGPDDNLRTKTYEILASNDGINWENVTPLITRDDSKNAAGASEDIKINNDKYYLYYRLHITDTFGTRYQNVGCAKLQFYGRAMNDVPKMTSNTTPEGEVVASSRFNDSYSEYYTFDKIINDENRTWICAHSEASPWIYYKFEKPVVVTKAIVVPFNNDTNSYKDFKIQASNTGLDNDWEDLYEGSHSNYAEVNYCEFNNSNEYLYYRFLGVSYLSGSYYIRLSEVDFFYRNMEDPHLIYHKGLNASTLLELARWTGTQYDDMEQILQDEKAIRQIMTVHDSVDYIADILANVTDAAVEFFNNDLVAKWVNLRDYALDKFEVDANIKAVLDEVDKYGYGEWALVGQVPVMTSNTAPYGEVIFDHYTTTSSTRYPYYAFNGNLTNHWISYGYANDDTGNLNDKLKYIGYKFTKPMLISLVEFESAFAQGSEGCECPISVEASEDNVTWDKLVDYELIAKSPKVSIPIKPEKEYLYYRISTLKGNTKGYNASRYAFSASSVQFYAWAPKGCIPVMTSNTAPYGVVSACAVHSSSYSAFKAFDGDESTWWATPNGWSSNRPWIQYNFVNPVCVKSFFVRPNQQYQGFKGYEIQGSNDGTTFEVVDSGVFVNYPAKENYVNISNDNYYLYYRLVCLDGDDPSSNKIVSIYSLQFYGRSLNVSVPAMTSNTAPYGEIIAPTTWYSNRDPYHAFDNDTSSLWLVSSGTLIKDAFCGFNFARKISLKRFKILTGTLPGSSYGGIYFDLGVKGSNDGINWEEVELKSEAKVTNSTKTIDMDLLNEKSYTHYKIYIKNSNTEYAHVYGQYGWHVYIIQFYGSDYSEREFEIGSTMKYIYDHGVKLDEFVLETAASSCIAEEKPDYLYLYSPTVDKGANASITVNFANYTIERCIIGDELTPSSPAWGGIGAGASSFKRWFDSIADLPNNIYIDVSTINTTDVAMVSATKRTNGANQVATIKEWWLE